MVNFRESYLVKALHVHVKLRLNKLSLIIEFSTNFTIPTFLDHAYFIELQRYGFDSIQDSDFFLSEPFEECTFREDSTGMLQFEPTVLCYVLLSESFCINFYIDVFQPGL